MTPAQLRASAVIIRHFEWCIDQADFRVVRDLPETQRRGNLDVAEELACVLGQSYGPEAAERMLGPGLDRMAYLREILPELDSPEGLTHTCACGATFGSRLQAEIHVYQDHPSGEAHRLGGVCHLWC